MKTPQFKIRKFRIWSYDVWGNADDGFNVNDRFSHGYVSIKCRRKVFNAGTEHEFSSYEPTDRQLSRALGVTGCDWAGSDGTFYAEQKSNGQPVGELSEES